MVYLFGLLLLKMLNKRYLEYLVEVEDILLITYVKDMVVEDCVLNSACQCIRLSCPSDGTIRHGVFRNLKMSGFNGVLSSHPVRYLLDGEHGSCKMEDITVENCDIDVAGSPIVFDVNPGVTLREFGNVTFRNVRLKAKNAIKLLGTGDTVLRNIRFENVTGTALSSVPSSVTGVDGCRVVDCTLRNVRLKCRGLGKSQSEKWLAKPVPENPGGYPEAHVFKHALTAWGLYARHVDGLKLENCEFELLDGTTDSRKKIVLDDVK